MGRSPCCSKQGLNSGAWTAEEDRILSGYIRIHGHGRWRNLPKRAGLNRCGQSCRLRWTHYLRPDIKRGNISPDEEELIIRMHRLLGNRWSLIAGRLPGRTDNEIKNYWNTHLKRKKEGQPNLKKTRPESRPPLQNGAFKTTPEKIRMAVRHYQTITPDPCSNIGSSDEAFKLCQIHGTYTNSSKTCCDLFVKDSIPEDDSERIAFCMADAYNLAETEADQHESLHGSDHFAANAATVDELLFGLDDLSSPGYKLSDFSAGFKLEDFYSGPATFDAERNEFEHESNMQQVNSIVTLPDDQRMKEFYDSTEPVDWNHVLNYIIN